ncbi:MAG: DUF350 domain-containing protein [Lachnospiraceae bacterium]|nr:DUF350 domain-containing protein [Lachnospiraceae bacterium]
MIELLYDILNVAIYSVLGIVLMLVGNFLIDLIVPCHFPTEIKKGNIAVGWLSAGSFIGIGMILRTVIMSPAAVVTETLLSGITSSIIYFVVGIAFFMLGYVTVLLFNKKYNLNDEIGKGNTAAGVMVFGIFVGLSLIISGAIN